MEKRAEKRKVCSIYMNAKVHHQTIDKVEAAMARPCWFSQRITARTVTWEQALSGGSFTCAYNEQWVNRKPCALVRSTSKGALFPCAPPQGQSVRFFGQEQRRLRPVSSRLDLICLAFKLDQASALTGNESLATWAQTRTRCVCTVRIGFLLRPKVFPSTDDDLCLTESGTEV